MYNIDDILRSLSSYLGLPAPVRLFEISLSVSKSEPVAFPTPLLVQYRPKPDLLCRESKRKRENEKGVRKRETEGIN